MEEKNFKINSNIENNNIEVNMEEGEVSDSSYYMKNNKEYREIYLKNDNLSKNLSSNTNYALNQNKYIKEKLQMSQNDDIKEKNKSTKNIISFQININDEDYTDKNKSKDLFANEKNNIENVVLIKNDTMKDNIILDSNLKDIDINKKIEIDNDKLTVGKIKKEENYNIDNIINKNLDKTKYVEHKILEKDLLVNNLLTVKTSKNNPNLIPNSETITKSKEIFKNSIINKNRALSECINANLQDFHQISINNDEINESSIFQMNKTLQICDCDDNFNETTKSNYIKIELTDEKNQDSINLKNNNKKLIPVEKNYYNYDNKPKTNSTSLNVASKLKKNIVENFTQNNNPFKLNDNLKNKNFYNLATNNPNLNQNMIGNVISNAPAIPCNLNNNTSEKIKSNETICENSQSQNLMSMNTKKSIDVIADSDMNLVSNSINQKNLNGNQTQNKNNLIKKNNSIQQVPFSKNKSAESDPILNISLNSYVHQRITNSDERKKSPNTDHIRTNESNIDKSFKKEKLKNKEVEDEDNDKQNDDKQNKNKFSNKNKKNVKKDKKLITSKCCIFCKKDINDPSIILKFKNSDDFFTYCKLFFEKLTVAKKDLFQKSCEFFEKYYQEKYSSFDQTNYTNFKSIKLICKSCFEENIKEENGFINILAALNYNIIISHTNPGYCNSHNSSNYNKSPHVRANSNEFGHNKRITENSGNDSNLNDAAADLITEIKATAMTFDQNNNVKNNFSNFSNINSNALSGEILDSLIKSNIKKYEIESNNANNLDDMQNSNILKEQGNIVLHKINDTNVKGPTFILDKKDKSLEEKKNLSKKFKNQIELELNEEIKSGISMLHDQILKEEKEKLFNKSKNSLNSNNSSSNIHNSEIDQINDISVLSNSNTNSNFNFKIEIENSLNQPKSSSNTISNIEFLGKKTNRQEQTTKIKNKHKMPNLSNEIFGEIQPNITGFSVSNTEKGQFCDLNNENLLISNNVNNSNSNSNNSRNTKNISLENLNVTNIFMNFDEKQSINNVINEKIISEKEKEKEKENINNDSKLNNHQIINSNKEDIIRKKFNELNKMIFDCNNLSIEKNLFLESLHTNSENLVENLLNTNSNKIHNNTNKFEDSNSIENFEIENKKLHQLNSKEIKILLNTLNENGRLNNQRNLLSQFEDDKNNKDKEKSSDLENISDFNHLHLMGFAKSNQYTNANLNQGKPVEFSQRENKGIFKQEEENNNFDNALKNIGCIKENGEKLIKLSNLNSKNKNIEIGNILENNSNSNNKINSHADDTENKNYFCKNNNISIMQRNQIDQMNSVTRNPSENNIFELKDDVINKKNENLFELNSNLKNLINSSNSDNINNQFFNSSERIDDNFKLQNHNLNQILQQNSNTNQFQIKQNVPFNTLQSLEDYQMNQMGSNKMISNILMNNQILTQSGIPGVLSATPNGFGLQPMIFIQPIQQNSMIPKINDNNSLEKLELNKQINIQNLNQTSQSIQNLSNVQGLNRISYSVNQNQSPQKLNTLNNDTQNTKIQGNNFRSAHQTTAFPQNLTYGLSYYLTGMQNIAHNYQGGINTILPQNQTLAGQGLQQPIINQINPIGLDYNLVGMGLNNQLIPIPMSFPYPVSLGINPSLGIQYAVPIQIPMQYTNMNHIHVNPVNPVNNLELLNKVNSINPQISHLSQINNIGAHGRNHTLITPGIQKQNTNNNQIPLQNQNENQINSQQNQILMLNLNDQNLFHHQLSYGMNIQDQQNNNFLNQTGSMNNNTVFGNNYILNQNQVTQNRSLINTMSNQNMNFKNINKNLQSNIDCASEEIDSQI